MSLTKRMPPFPYSCIVHKPDPAVEYYEAYKNIGRKYTILKRSDLSSTVLQSTIDEINFGSIFIKGGKYDNKSVSLEFPVTKYLALIAEHGKPDLSHKYLLTKGVVIRYSGTDYAIKSSGYEGGDEDGRLILKNFLIQCNHYEGRGNGIYTYGFDEVRIEDVIVCDPDVHKYTGTKGIHLLSPSPNRHYLKNVDSLGFDYGFYYDVDNLVFLHCLASTCNYGFYGGTNHGHVTMFYPHAYDCVNEGIRFQSGHQCSLYSPFIEGITSATGVAIKLLGEYAYLIDNPYVSDLAGGAVPLEVANPSLLSLNISRGSSAWDGYRTKHSFQATILNGQASVTVNHNLITTPHVVVATGRDADTVDVTCTARTATQITLTVPAGVGGDRIVDVYVHV